MDHHTPDAGAQTFALEGELGPRDASHLHGALLHAVREHRSLVIDARRLASLDVSIMQLMIAAFRTAERLGHELSVASEPGDALEQTLARAGLKMPNHNAHAHT